MLLSLPHLARQIRNLGVTIVFTLPPFPGEPRIVVRYICSPDDDCIVRQFAVKTWVERRLEEVKAELESLKSHEKNLQEKKQERVRIPKLGQKLFLIHQKMREREDEHRAIQSLMLQLDELEDEYLKRAEEKAKILKERGHKPIRVCNCGGSNFFTLDDAALHLKHVHRLSDKETYRDLEGMVEDLTQLREAIDVAKQRKKSHAELEEKARFLAKRILPLLKCQSAYTLKKVFGEFPRWVCPKCHSKQGTSSPKSTKAPAKFSTEDFEEVPIHLIECHGCSLQEAAKQFDEWIDHALREAVF